MFFNARYKILWNIEFIIVILQYNIDKMGLTKTEIFTKKQNELAVIAKAIGHPARVAILQYLLEKQTCICKEIVEELPLSQPTVSQHLRELKTAGLIQGSIEGKKICYCLNPEKFKQLFGFFQPFMNVDCKMNC